MTIRAVVFDIGSVLEIIDESLFPGPLERRLGLRSGEFSAVTDELPGDPTLGEVTEAQMRSHWQSAFDLDDEQASLRPGCRLAVARD